MKTQLITYWESVRDNQSLTPQRRAWIMKHCFFKPRMASGPFTFCVPGSGNRWRRRCGRPVLKEQAFAAANNPHAWNKFSVTGPYKCWPLPPTDPERLEFLSEQGLPPFQGLGPFKLSKNPAS